MKKSLIAARDTLLSCAVNALEHHPKLATALLASLMLGGGGAAFAVASLDPEPSTIVVREVLEAVTPLPMQDQVDVLGVHSFKLFRSETTRANDTAEALLVRLGVDDPRAVSFLRTDPTFRAQVLGHAGRICLQETFEHIGLLHDHDCSCGGIIIRHRKRLANPFDIGCIPCYVLRFVIVGGEGTAG